MDQTMYAIVSSGGYFDGFAYDGKPTFTGANVCLFDTLEEARECLESFDIEGLENEAIHDLGIVLVTFNPL
jgi:hypothetical protein